MKTIKLIDQLLSAGIEMNNMIIVPERNSCTYQGYFGMCNPTGIHNIVKCDNQVKMGVYVYDKWLKETMSEDNYYDLINKATDGFEVQSGYALPEFIYFFKYVG